MSAISDEYRRSTPPLAYDATEDEIALAKLIDDQIRSADRDRAPWLAQLHNGLALYNTETQWHSWDARERRLQATPLAFAGQKRVTVNIIAPTVDTTAAVLTGNQPGWMVTPATSDDEDVQSAKACDKLLEHVYRENETASLLTEAMVWAEIGGITWINVAWDPTRGDLVESEPAEGPGMEPDGAEHRPYGWELGEANKPERRTGFPVIQVVPPDSVTWDPGAKLKNLSDCRWINHRAYLHVDEVHERWPHRAFAVKADTAVEDSLGGTILSALQGGLGGSGHGQQNAPDRVCVDSYYERPSPRHRNGRYAVKAGSVILEQGELECGELPFVCWRYNPEPGRLWGVGLVARVADQQRQVNYQLSKLAEMAALHANNKWRVPRGSISQTSVTNQAGEVIEYDQNKGPPEPIPPAPISPEFRDIAVAAEEYIYKLAGVSAITRGEVPPQISGRAASILADEDAKKRQPAVVELAEALQRMGRLVLQLWQRNMEMDVTIHVLGAEKRLEAMAFKAGSIRSTDVRIDMASMAIRHPTIQREQTMQAFERGMLGDVSDPDVVATARRALSLPGIDVPTEGADPEESYAQEQAYELLNGADPPVYPWENHAAHVRVLRKLLQTSDVRSAPPDVLQSITRALATREAYIAAASGGTPWWQKYAAPEALELLQPAAPPQSPPAPEQPGTMPPPPYDAFGAPPEAFIPQAPPPLPTGEATMGMPLEGPGVQGLSARAALQQPDMFAAM